MSDHYLFPCKCGTQFEVTVSDAGKWMTCPKCEFENELPGLRDLRQLDLVPEEADVSGKRSSWGRQNNILFSLGMGIGMLFLIGAAIFFWIGFTKFDAEKPNIHGGWVETADRLPPEVPVWAYAPEPGSTKKKNYQFTMYDPQKQVWIFQESEETRPIEYFTKWGPSSRTSAEASTRNADLKDLWKFWYETDPKQQIPEWLEPMYVINGRFVKTYYTFAGVCGAISLIGFILVGLAFRK